MQNDEVHVWLTRLEAEPDRVQNLYETLDTHERRRADRSRFERDRRRFIISHGLLRTILSRYLAVSPADLAFTISPHGKPSLNSVPSGASLRFNMSHARDLAIYAIGTNREIGVDIEWVHDDFEFADIAHRFFSSREVTALRGLPHALQTQAFFTCWTRKEAYIKARGEGLSLPLGQFDVTLAPGEPAALLATRPDARETSRWQLQQLNAPDGYVASLAVEGKQLQVVQRQLPGHDAGG